MRRPLPALLTFTLMASLLGTVRAAPPVIPPELLADDHFREEFGINELTTPSIAKIFEQLDLLGEVPAGLVRRDWPEKPPTGRVAIAANLGRLIADGFFVVASRDLAGVESAGRSIVRHASALGAGLHVTRHTKALVDSGRKGDWAQLQREMAAAQHDVERELITLRDVDLVHLIGLGGWLRALELTCTVLEVEYTPERADLLRRVDIAEYYISELETFHPALKASPQLRDLPTKLAALHDELDVPPGAPISRDRVQAASRHVSAIFEQLLPENEPPNQPE